MRLQYRAPADCPSEADFAAAVKARGGEFAEERLGPVIEVTLEAKETGFAGALRVRGSRSSSQERAVEAARCAEIVEALAVVAAIALRSEEPVAAQSAAEPAQPRPTTSGTTSSEARTEARAAPESEANSAGRRLRATSEVGNESVAVPAGTLHFDNAFSLTGSVGTAFGLIPGALLPRYDLSLTRANFVTTPAAQSYRVGPILRLRFSFHGKGTVRTTDTTTEISGFSVGFGGCMSPLFDTEGWVLLLCTDFAAGKMQLASTERGGASIQSKSVGFATTSLGPEIEYNFSRLFHVGLRFGAEATLKELSAERRDGSQIFQSSVIYGFATLGLGMHF